MYEADTQVQGDQGGGRCKEKMVMDGDGGGGRRTEKEQQRGGGGSEADCVDKSRARKARQQKKPNGTQSQTRQRRAGIGEASKAERRVYRSRVRMTKRTRDEVNGRLV